MVATLRGWRVAIRRERSRTMRAKLTQRFVWLVFFSPSLALGAPGDVDPTFAYPRPAVLEPDSTNAVPLADGFLVIKSRDFDVAGTNSTLEVTRFDEDGHVVASFGSGGTVRIAMPGAVNVATAVHGMPDGSMLLAGFQRVSGAVPDNVATIARLDASGRLDPAFGVGGIVTFDVPGQADRVGAIDVLADGRLLTGVWSRVQADPYGDCSNDRVSLVRLNPNGTGPEVIYFREKNAFADNGCRNVMTLQVMPDQRFYFGSHVETVVFDSPDPTGWRPVRALGCCYGPFSVLEAAGVVWSQPFVGPLLDWQRFPAYIYDDNYGASARMLRDTLNGMGFPVPRTESLLVPDGYPPAWYLGFSSDGGVAGIAKVRTDGMLDTGWAGGTGVIRIDGSGRPNVSANEGLANDVRLISVRPGGETLVVVTADGIIQRRFAKSGPAHGQIRFAVDNTTDVPEARGTVQIRVQRMGGTDGVVGVDYSVGAALTDCRMDPCARPGQDFGASSGRLEWADGDGSDRTITVGIINDTQREPLELFYIELTAPIGGAQVATPFGILEIDILDDDPETPSDAGGGNSSGGGAGGGGATGAGTLCLLLLAMAARLKKRSSGLHLRLAAAAGVALSTMSLLLPPVAGAESAPGDVDPNFVYPTPQVPEPDSTNLVALPSGFIVVESLPADASRSSATLRLTRIDEDGRLVAGFGTNGRLEQSLPEGTNLSTVARFLPNGTILLGGFSRGNTPASVTGAIARLEASGRLDTSFGEGGIVKLDLPGDLDRVVGVDALPDGRVVAAVWTRLEAYYYDCDLQSVSLVRVSSVGGNPETLAGSRGEPCRNAAALRVITEGFPEWNLGAYSVLFGKFDGLMRLDDRGGYSEIGATYRAAGPFAIGTPGSLAYVRYDFGGAQVVLNGAPPLERGLPLGWIAGGTSAYDLTVSNMVANGASGGWYVGLASGSGRAAVAKYQPNGSIDTAWGGGDGVVAIEGTGLTPAEDPWFYHWSGVATDIRAISVRPGGNVVVATSEGIVRRFIGPSAAVNHGGLALEHPQEWRSEEQGPTSLKVSRLGGSMGAVSVQYRVVAIARCSDTVVADCTTTPATEGEDFVPASGRLEWNDGDNSDRRIDVNLRDDDLPEHGEFLAVVIDEPRGGASILDGRATLAISTSDASQVRLTPTGQTHPESGGAINVRVSRTGGLRGAVSVEYRVVSMSVCAGCAPAGSLLATEGEDFVATTGRLSWAAGDGDDKLIEVMINDDAVPEPNEVFFVQIYAVPAGIAEIQGGSLQVTIESSDGWDSGSGSGGGDSSRGGGAGAMNGTAWGLMVLALARLAAGQRRRLQTSLSRRSAT
jgi:uncharacterized delta-60 repeat protein